jgi:hypothetical protein
MLAVVLINLRRNTAYKQSSRFLRFHKHTPTSLGHPNGKGRLFFMLKKRTAVVGLLAAALLVAGGCSSKPQQTKTYSNDGVLGITNTNPSLPLSHTYHNYQADTDMMKGALGLVPGITNSRIMLNGSHATVKLYVPKDTAEAERARIQQGAEYELNKAAPRYRYYVKVVK